MIAEFLVKPQTSPFSSSSRVELILCGAECLVSTSYCLRSRTHAQCLRTRLLNGLLQTTLIPNPTALTVERRSTTPALANGINHL